MTASDETHDFPIPDAPHPIQRWWDGLSETDREDLRRRWDPRGDDVSRLAPDTADGPWRKLPIRLVGHFVDPENERDDELMHQELLEFIVNHEDIVFFLEERVFHICRTHPLAHRVLRERRLPARFECPMRGADCPMKRISESVSGREVRFDVQVG